MQTSIGQASTFGTGPFPTSRAASASDSSASNPSTTNSATVTANDFLQLLVTEMKNQDPTSNTDPNEYISQLVQVNSLEQLVQINQEIGSSSSGSSTSGASGSTADASAAPAVTPTQPSASQNAGNSVTQSGNVPTSGASAAALAVSRALQPSSAGASAAELQTLIRRQVPHGGVAHNSISMAH